MNTLRNKKYRHILDTCCNRITENYANPHLLPQGIEVLTKVPPTLLPQGEISMYLLSKSSPAILPAGEIEVLAPEFK